MGDEAVEDNFNLLLDEPVDSAKVNTEDQCSEIVQSTHLNEDLPEEPSYEDVIGGNDADDHGDQQTCLQLQMMKRALSKLNQIKLLRKFLQMTKLLEMLQIVTMITRSKMNLIQI